MPLNFIHEGKFQDGNQSFMHALFNFKSLIVHPFSLLKLSSKYSWGFYRLTFIFYK